MYRNPQAGTPAGPVQYAEGGYEASFGRYEIDARAPIFTYKARLEYEGSSESDSGHTLQIAASPPV